MRRAVVPVLAVLVGLAACGGAGTSTANDLQKHEEALTSVAAEGALLASGVARGRTLEPFARIHSGVLAEQAASEVDALRKPAPARLDSQRRRLEARAVRVASALRRLHGRPTNRRLAATIRRELERLAR